MGTLHGQDHIDLFGFPLKGKRTRLQLGGIEPRSYGDSASARDFQSTAGGCLHGGGLVVPSDDQISRVFSKRQAQRWDRRDSGGGGDAVSPDVRQPGVACFEAERAEHQDGGQAQHKSDPPAMGGIEIGEVKGRLGGGR